MADDAGAVQTAPHYYGGQAVVEGVMMRGADRWAVAVRRPDGAIWLECHPVSDLPARRPWLKWPMLRGTWALVDSLTIGMRALNVSALRSAPEEEADLGGSAAVGASLVLAFVLFAGLFIVLPSAATKGVDVLLGSRLGDGAAFHLIESGVRLVIFLAYLWGISLLSDIRRVFAYHGAEHQTIAAWEHGDPLDPPSIGRYSTVHVRCGTNFLILVMLLAIVIYTVGGVIVPPPAGIGRFGAIGYHVALRLVLLPVVAGVAYEALRLGARRESNPIVAAIMAPGRWLQRITTKPPEEGMVEVAVRAFEAVVPAGARVGRVPGGLTSPVVIPADSLPVELADATVLDA
jgi:uncharacterized protein YqhQ